jgi:hypothetical protein
MPTPTKVIKGMTLIRTSRQMVEKGVGIRTNGAWLSAIVDTEPFPYSYFDVFDALHETSYLSLIKPQPLACQRAESFILVANEMKTLGKKVF